MLRFIFIFSILGAGLVAALFSPLNALLLYLWWAYFRPDYWVYSTVLLDLHFSLGLGLFLLARTAVSGEFAIRLDLRSLLLFALLFIGTASTFQSPYFPVSWVFLWDFARMLLVLYVVAMLATDTKRLRLIILVLSLSLGFEAAKQGWAEMYRNPGATNMNEVAFLGDNNLVAVGMLMLVGLLVSLARTAKYRAERWGWVFMIVGVLYRAISTYSRGGFLAAIGLGIAYVLRSPRKLRAATGLVLATLVVTSVLSTSYWDRMQTINVSQEEQEGKERDDSALGRLHFWGVGLAMAAEHPLLGVGVNSYPFAYDAFDTTDGEFGRSRSVHSMWFGWLAEVGYVGTGIFLTILFLAFQACWRARRYADLGLVSKELGHFGTGIESALVAMGIGATFVIFQYNEMMWHVLALSMAVHYVTQKELAEHAAAAAAARSETADHRLPRPHHTPGRALADPLAVGN